MKKLLFVIALAVVATACDNNENDKSVEFGTINIEVATRSEVSEASNRLVLSDDLVPEADELKVEIVGNNNTYSWPTLAGFNADKMTLKFTSAPYTVTLSHGNKGVEGWSKPYFEGSTNIEVPMYGLTADANIEVMLMNSIVAISTSENFDGYFSDIKFKVNNIEWEPARNEHLFANTGKAVIVCTAKRPTGSDITLTQEVILNPTTRHTALFDLSAGNTSITISFDDKIVATEELEFELNE